MAGKTYVAKQETSEAIQADTTAIRNTLGDFPGGGIEDNVAAKLLELENRIDEIAVKQNYQNDDFYLNCCLNFSSIRVGTEDLNDTEYTTVLDVNGSGVLSYIQRVKYISFNIYLDDKLVFYLTDDTITANKNIYFGITSYSYSESNSSTTKITDLSTNFNNSNSGTLYYYILPTFKKSLKVTAKKTVNTAASLNIFKVNYGIGGAAV